MKNLFISILLVLIPVSIFSTKLFFSIPDSPIFNLKLKKCSEEKIEFLQFKDSNFEYENNRETVKLMKVSSLNSSIQIVDQLYCVHNIKMNEKEKKEFLYSFENSIHLWKESLELFHRMIYFYSKDYIKSPEDEMFIANFLKTKIQLYKIFEDRLQVYYSWERIDESNRKSLEDEFYNIFLSLQKLHFEFYFNIAPELRKELLKKVY